MNFTCDEADKIFKCVFYINQNSLCRHLMRMMMMN